MKNDPRRLNLFQFIDWIWLRQSLKLVYINLFNEYSDDNQSQSNWQQGCLYSSRTEWPLKPQN